MEFFDKIIETLSEPTNLSIFLLCLGAISLALLIWIFVLSLKLRKTRRKLEEHLCDTKIASQLCELSKEEKTRVEEKHVDLEPSVLPEAVKEPEPEKEVIIITEPAPVVSEPAPVIKRDTSGIMKYKFSQLVTIAEKLGTVKTWKNKTEVADAIKLILKSEKCTKVQIIDVLSLDFIGLKEDDKKKLSAKQKAELISTLKDILRK